ncbi:MAG: SDR family NAD(P)-dependent oxidoreductase [Candidatus Ranarchaeia archaeon]
MKPVSELISLKEKKAVITGAAAGIGESTAIRFAEAGADLELLDVNFPKLRVLQEKLTRFSVQVGIHKIDLSNKDQIESVWKEMSSDPPGILVNNAGIYPFKPFLEVDQQFLEHVLNVNLNSVFWMCQNMIKYRLNKGGVIVNVASIEALLPFRNELAHYDISKAGIIAFTRALAKEYGEKGFRVNVVLPGGIITPGTKNVAKGLLRLKFGILKSGLDFKSRLPMGRFGKPDEIARMILVLACDLSSYVQGAMYAVDGGFLSA